MKSIEKTNETIKELIKDELIEIEGGLWYEDFWEFLGYLVTDTTRAVMYSGCAPSSMAFK